MAARRTISAELIEGASDMAVWQRGDLRVEIVLTRLGSETALTVAAGPTAR